MIARSVAFTARFQSSTIGRQHAGEWHDDAKQICDAFGTSHGIHLVITDRIFLARLRTLPVQKLWQTYE